MRELRGAGTMNVKHINGESNPADMFTKILSRQVFEKHCKFVMNLAGATMAGASDGVFARAKQAAAAVLYQATGAP